jgi:RNA polymerase sigma-70 factor (ECF subfamily)
MSSETENEKQLQSFFNKEYHSLKAYVHSKIENDVDRDAEDIIQDVALKIFSRKEIVPINNVAGFVYRSIRNKIVDIMRKRKPTRVDDEFDDQFTEFAEQFYGDSDNSYSEDMTSELKKAIFSLNPMYREIILAIDVEGYSYREISEETGIAEGTLLSRRHRAISQLYQKLKTQKDKI